MSTVPRACVIGWPIEHSRSPLIHGYWLKSYGIEGSYTKQAVHPDDIEAFLLNIAGHGFVGANVTVPHKRVAFSLADHREPSAVAVGAANTLWLDDGHLCAENTDTFGFMTYLGLKAPRWRELDGPVVILGAGGAARAIAFGFLEAGVSDVYILNRTRERADSLAAHFSGRVKTYDWQARNTAAEGASVLVNTTTLGMSGMPEIDIDLADMPAGGVIADIVYSPLETELLSRARKIGLVTVDGLGMLLHQAVPGFERWFGVRPRVTPELRNLVVEDLRSLKGRC